MLNITNKTLLDLNNRDLKINVKDEPFELKDDKRIDIVEWFPDFKSYVKYTHFFVFDKRMRLLDMTRGVFTGNNLYACDYLKFNIKDNIIEILDKLDDASYIKFLYNSKVILWDYDDFTDKMILTKNTDVPIYSEDLVRKGLIYFYQEEINSKDKLDDFKIYMKELERCEFMDK